MLSKPSDLPGPDVGCGLQARSEGCTWSTVSPVLLWSWPPSSHCPHCQHPLFVSEDPSKLPLHGGETGGCMASARTTPGQDRKLICLFYSLTALTYGKVGTLPSGTYLEFGSGWTRDSCSFTCQVVPWCLDQDTILPLSPRDVHLPLALLARLYESPTQAPGCPL